MELILEHYFLIVTLAYMLGFFAFGKAFGARYLSENPIDEITKTTLEEIVKEPLDDFIKLERIKSVVHHAERQEEISFILCGFSIISLVFIITVFQDKLAFVEWVIIFFSMAFIFEITSAFFYHDVQKNLYSFVGMIFQYGGIFSIMVGFFTYLYNVIPWSAGILILYFLGMVVFISLSIREIRFYAEYSKALEEGKDEPTH